MCFPAGRSCSVTKSKTGSMPDEHPAIMLIDPVGAIVVMDAFLTLIPLRCHRDPSQFGKGPRSCARWSIPKRLCL